MELKSIKLAGFKSFADPTVIPLQGHLTAIVGPNGCGKSNIVDAVRYVLSGAARQLRGESLGDIVFNGTDKRKPVGRAVVELILDNSDGRLQGEYAAYNEISIRREVNRDGDSQYYLNGTRCRRRDAVDVVLGTGLKYAIIEQGMITRLIEAKPEDLRGYLEEAAGISKYKERRKETESRLKHTRENLERLSDLRNELEKQLAHLQRQANAAERYKVLKQEERLSKAQLQALNWQALEHALSEQKTVLKQTASQLEAHQIEHEQLLNEITKLREQEEAETATLNAIQARYYEIGLEVVRLEQQLQQQRQHQQQLQQELQRLAQTQQSVQQHVVQDQQQIAALQQDIQLLEPEIVKLNEQALNSQHQLQTTEQAMRDSQTQWDSFQQQEANAKRLTEVEQTRLQHIRQTLQSNEQRLLRMQQEQQQLAVTPLEQEISAINEQLQLKQAKLEETQTHLTDTLQQITRQRETHTELAKQLDGLRRQLQQTQGRFASLKALQQAALGNNNQTLVTWLERQNLTQQPRLVQTLQVEKGWELAVETVLGDYLQAVCVPALEPLTSHLADFKQGQLTLIQATANTEVAAAASTELLLNKISSHFPLATMLANIYAVDDLTQALEYVKRLQANESVITREGIWLAPHWVRIAKPLDVQAGLLLREAELQTLAQTLQHQEQAVLKTQQELATAQTQLTELEQQREHYQQQVREQTHEQGNLRAELSAKQTRIEQMQQRLQRLTHDHTETQQQIAEAQQQAAAVEQSWQQATQQLQELTAQRPTFLQQRDNFRQQIDKQRSQLHTERQTLHQQQMRLEQARKQLEFLLQAIQRAEQQLADIQHNQQTLEAKLSAVKAPQHELQNQLQQVIAERSVIEQQLKAAQQQVAATKAALVDLETKRDALEKQVNTWRDALEQARIQQQAFELKQASHQEKIIELDFVLADLINEMPTEANQQQWEQNIAKIEQRIQRLGAINLAAIEEHQQISERKNYLDVQHADLTEAVNTLAAAIRKIDEESRDRLQDTYNKVNESFKWLFQRVFNGGQATLELTEENWLTTGITVRAQPPGKRNSTIHLLSGGEKTLTAIALIFALFQLNPSPFCMLDEVDAALDDANVGRFCHLVKEMAQQVQFIFISHNKQTIATAQQLIGVTMNEPGVSRLVTVDIKEAMALAAV